MHPETQKDLDQRFTYHPPTNEKQEFYAQVRSKAKELAELIAAELPDRRERSLALTKLEEAVMWANACMARNVPE